MANDIQILDKASCDVSAAVLSEIHVKSDPNSLWGCLGTSYTEELLYKPLTQDPNSSIALAQYKGKYIGFVVVTKIKPKRDNFLVLPYFSLVTYSEIILKVFKSKNSVQRLVTFYISRIRNWKSFSRSDYEIVAMMVIPEFQSKGVGDSLLNCMRKKFEKTIFCVFTNGERAKGFYEKKDFQLISSNSLGGQVVSFLVSRF